MDSLQQLEQKLVWCTRSPTVCNYLTKKFKCKQHYTYHDLYIQQILIEYRKINNNLRRCLIIYYNKNITEKLIIFIERSNNQQYKHMFEQAAFEFCT